MSEFEASINKLLLCENLIGGTLVECLDRGGFNAWGWGTITDVDKSDGIRITSDGNALLHMYQAGVDLGWGSVEVVKGALMVSIPYLYNYIIYPAGVEVPERFKVKNETS